MAELPKDEPTVDSAFCFDGVVEILSEFHTGQLWKEKIRAFYFDP